MDVHEMEYVEAKTVWTKVRKKDTLTGITYQLDLYRGCQYGCIYCEACNLYRGAGDGSRVGVVKDALTLLEKALKANAKGTVGLSSAHDPYMPLEQKLELTRGALRLLAKNRFPVHVMTKSDGVVRDADLLQEIGRTYAAVSFSMSSATDELALKLEPYAPPPSARFRAMRQLADQGIYTGVILKPVLPFVNDAIEDMEEVVEKAAEAGASYVLPWFGVHLPKGLCRYFYEQAERIFPKITNRYQVYFEGRSECMSPNAYYLNDHFIDKMQELGLNTVMKFYHSRENGQLSLF